ncbi:MAG: polysaccharide biosynthesis tyrosine autokinase, partial [Desulfobulbaceae bacterium]|nr:polysaccharide biosynthesis tyrosine autokinase [Desulfobulbaceae bacterium]
KDDVVSNIKAWMNTTLASWKDWIQSLFKTGLEPTTPDEEALSSDFNLVNAFSGRIRVEPIRNSRLVDVSVEAIDPKMAAKMANELVRAYIDQNLEAKLVAAKDAVQWLGDRIQEERRKVETAEVALLTYKEKFQIITDFSSDAEQITAQKLAQLNSQVVNAESFRVEAETRYNQAVALDDTPDMLDSIPEVLKNELVQEIKKMEVNLYNRMSELSKKYGKRHPQMQAIESELEDLQKRKVQEVKRVVNSLRNEYRLAVAKEESLKKALEKQKNESLEMNKKAVQYGVLQRQAESARQMYEMLIKRFKETSLTEEMKTGNIRIVDRAETPIKPVKPKKRLNLLLGLVVGLTLGIGLAFFLEYLDNTIKLPDEVRDYLKIPYLGPVPAFAKAKNRDGIPSDLVTLHSPKSTASESFRGIRTGVLFSSADKPPQVILVSSSGPGEGKTVCASNLAVAMAQSGSRVVLLDCDMRRPRLHKMFNISREVGVSNVLVGSSTLAEAMVVDAVPNLDVIPCGPIPPNPSEMIGSNKMKDLIETLRKDYTRIIIDSPPVTAVTDSAILAQAADGLILVIRAGDTPRQIVLNGVSHLKAMNAPILGAVLNGVNTGKDSYYYYQYYYYYYGEDGERRKRFKPDKNKGARLNAGETAKG